MTEKNDAVATQQPAGALATAAAVSGALAPAPDYLKKGTRGLEGTTQSDINIPRLALAQLGSPQVTDGDPRRIPGLTVGDLFNSITKQIYGREVHVQLLRRMPLRAMEFYDIDSGGGVKTANVPLNSPLLKWGTSGKKKDDKPKATLFRDFIGVIIPGREMISLSFKSGALTLAKTLWGLVIMRNRDVFAGLYRISTGVKLDPKPHQIYLAENAGWVSEHDAIAGEAQMEAVNLITFEQIERATDDPREPGDEADTFDPSKMADSEM